MKRVPAWRFRTVAITSRHHEQPPDAGRMHRKAGNADTSPFD